MVAGSITYVTYKQNEIFKRQRELESSMLLQKDLGDSLVRTISQYATSKDIEAIIKDNKVDVNKINKDIEVLGAKIDHISVVTGKSQGYNLSGQVSTGSKPIPSNQIPENNSCPLDKGCFPDTWGYYKNTQYFNIFEKFKDVSVPFGKVGFSVPKDKPWEVSIYSRDYKLISTSVVDESKRSITYNSLKIIADNKEYSIPIIAENYQTIPEYKFRWFSPKIFLGIDAGFTNQQSLFLGPSAQLSLINYGIYKSIPEFSFLQIGLAFDMDKKINYISITPVAYNIGKHLPIIENTYFGASFDFSPLNNYTAITAGLRVGL